MKTYTLPGFYVLCGLPRPPTEVKESSQILGGWSAYRAAIRDGCYLQEGGRFSLVNSNTNTCHGNSLDESILEELDLLADAVSEEDDDCDDHDYEEEADEVAANGQSLTSTSAFEICSSSIGAKAVVKSNACVKA